MAVKSAGCGPTVKLGSEAQKMNEYALCNSG